MGARMLNLDRNEIIAQMKKAESERNEEAFYQSLTLKSSSCAKCDYFNQTAIKRESDMTDDEKKIFEALKKMPNYKIAYEYRDLILAKSNHSVWCYLCDKCYKNKPKDWQ